MSYKRNQTVEELTKLVRGRGKKFVSIEEGAKLYSLGIHTFRALAEDANAIYRVKKKGAGEYGDFRRIP